MTIEAGSLNNPTNFRKVIDLAQRLNVAFSDNKINPTLRDIVENPPVNERNIPNFPLEDTVNLMRESMNLQRRIWGPGDDLKDSCHWRKLPWSPTRVTPHRCLGAEIPFSDRAYEKGLAVRGEYFPEKETSELVGKIIKRSEELGRPLTLPEQFNESLGVVDAYPTAAAILLHAAIRCRGRGLDTVVNPNCEVDIELSRRLSLSIAPFNPGIDNDHFGGTYHYWGTAASGMISEAMKKDHFIGSTLCAMAPQLAEPIARFRKFIGKEVLHDHSEVDKLGYHTGKLFAQSYLS